MVNIQLQLPMDQKPTLNLQPQLIVQKQIKSTFIDEYKRFFSDVERQQILTQLELAQLHRFGNIYFTQNDERIYLKAKVINHTTNYEVIRLQIQIKSTVFQLNVINMDCKSQTHLLKDISDTSASVFVNPELLPSSVVKCTPLKDGPFAETFLRVAKEFSILKIASELEVGPKLSKIFGFDLVVCEECIEFCMQRCKPISILQVNEERKLKHKLLKLHKLKIVHSDIKPTNICYSPSLKEPVFIDYGFSNVLEEPFGLKTRTFFMGSLSYCSPQMVSCYKSLSYAYVDLYYNDAYCLQKTFEQHLKRQQLNKKLFPNSNEDENDRNDLRKVDQSKFTYFLVEIQIKHCIYTSSRSLFDQSNSYLLQLFKEKIISFCLTLPFTKYIQKIYNTYYPNNPYQQSFCLNYCENGVKQNNLYIESSLLKFQEHYIKMTAGINIYQSEMTQIQCQIEESKLKEILLNEKVVRKLSKEDYLQKYARFTNFQNNIASFAQRAQASILFILIFGLQVIHQDQFSPIIVCQRYVLEYFISCQRLSSTQVIPIVLYNIILLEGVNEQELNAYFSAISEMRISNQKMMAFFIFKCFYIIEIIDNIIHPRYRVIKCTPAYRKMLILKLRQLYSKASKINDQVTMFVLLQIIGFQKKDYEGQNLRQYEKLLKFRHKFLEAGLFSQIKIYYYLNFLKARTSIRTYLSEIEYLELIKEQERRRCKKYCVFQVYHFTVYLFYQRISNNEAKDRVYNNFQRCLDNKRLVDRFHMTNFQEIQNWKMYDKDRLEYYQGFLKYLEENPNVSQKILLTRVHFITKCYETMYAILSPEIQSLLPLIFEKLRLRFPLRMLREFIPCYLQFSKAENMFNVDCLHLVMVIQRLYKDHPQIDSEIDFFKQQLTTINMQTHQPSYNQFDTLVFNLHSYLLRIRNDFRKFLDNLKEFLKSSSLTYGKLSCLVEINELSITRPEFASEKTENLEMLYNYINTSNLWHLLFTLEKVKWGFEGIHLYIFESKRYELFFEVHLKLTDNLKSYPSKENLLSYSTNFIRILQFYKVVNTFFADHFSSSGLQQEANKYLAIFYAISIVRLILTPALSQTLIKLIRRSLNGISYLAKMIVISHLYHYLLKAQLIGRSTKFYRRRYITFLLRQSLKNAISNSSYSQLRKFFTNLPKGKLKSMKMENLMAKVRHYYDHILEKETTLNKFYQYYQSPLTSH